MKPTTPLTEGARIARAALLKRAQWIVDANIHAACGYSPVLPPDMQDFDMVRNMDPDSKALAALLKGVMPAMSLKDDAPPVNLIPRPTEDKYENELDALQLEFQHGKITWAQYKDLQAAAGVRFNAYERVELLAYVKQQEDIKLGIL